MLHQGEHGFHVLVVLRGRVKVIRTGSNGERLLLAIREPGDLVGEAAVFDGQPRSASVVTAGDCLLHIVEAAEFREFVRRHNLAEAIIRHTLARLREADDLRAELAAMPVRQRVARMILRFSGDAQNEVVDLPQEELAHAVGASRNAVVAELAEFRSRGILHTGRRRIVVANVSRLRAAAFGTVADT